MGKFFRKIVQSSFDNFPGKLEKPYGKGGYVEPADNIENVRLFGTIIDFSQRQRFPFIANRVSNHWEAHIIFFSRSFRKRRYYPTKFLKNLTRNTISKATNPSFIMNIIKEEEVRLTELKIMKIEKAKLHFLYSTSNFYEFRNAIDLHR